MTQYLHQSPTHFFIKSHERDKFLLQKMKQVLKLSAAIIVVTKMQHAQLITNSPC